MEKSKVYFCREITPENVVKMYKALGKELPGRVAVKVHSGEKGNQNYLRPDFMKGLVEKLNATVVECNTAYDGKRNAGLLFWRRNTALPEQKTPIGRGMMPAPVRKPPCA